MFSEGSVVSLLLHDASQATGHESFALVGLSPTG
jgi:hypothetical protein